MWEIEKEHTIEVDADFVQHRVDQLVRLALLIFPLRLKNRIKEADDASALCDPGAAICSV